MISPDARAANRSPLSSRWGEIRHVILDRDGVLNEEADDGGYIGAPEKFRWLPYARQALAQLHALGLRVSVATNQSGIGRGLVESADVAAVHAAMCRQSTEASGAIAAVYVCPHAPEDGCACRKPAPGLIRQAIAESPFRAEHTLVVGDDLRDLEAARAAGVQAALLRTGKGRRHELQAATWGVPIYDDLGAFARDLTETQDLGHPGTSALRMLFAEHQRVVADSLENLLPSLDLSLLALRACLKRGGKILACGNGGSAADAQHFVAELVGRFQNDGRALAAIALAGDVSTFTSVANDFGFAQVYARQVEALARPGDLLLAISTSGNSPNILMAAEAARRHGCRVIAMTGRGGGALAGLADICLRVPSDSVARIQEIHGLCIHGFAQGLDCLRAPGTD